MGASNERLEELLNAQQSEIRNINARLVVVEQKVAEGTVMDYSMELDRHTELLHEIKQQTDRIGAPPDAVDTVWSCLDRHDMHFHAIHAHLDRHDVHFQAIDAHQSRHDEHLQAIDARLKTMDARLDRQDQRFEAIETRLDTMDTRLGSMESVLKEILARLN